MGIVVTLFTPLNLSHGLFESQLLNMQTGLQKAMDDLIIMKTSSICYQLCGDLLLAYRSLKTCTLTIYELF